MNEGSPDIETRLAALDLLDHQGINDDLGTETLQREDTLMPLLKGLVAESATGGATTSKTPAKPAEKTPTTPAPPQKKAT